jgi:hypothetical protein
MTITDPQMDDKIRAAIRYSYDRAELNAVSAVTGVNLNRLIWIMDTTGPLSLEDRAILGAHIKDQ